MQFGACRLKDTIFLFLTTTTLTLSDLNQTQSQPSSIFKLSIDEVCTSILFKLLTGQGFPIFSHNEFDHVRSAPNPNLRLLVYSSYLSIKFDVDVCRSILFNLLTDKGFLFLATTTMPDPHQKVS